MGKTDPRPAEISFAYGVLYDLNVAWMKIQGHLARAVKPVGKLKRVHFVGAPEKRYVDERGQVFLVQFYPREVLFLYNVTKG